MSNKTLSPEAQVMDVLLGAVRAANEQCDAGLEVAPDAVLLGPDSGVDSLSLIVIVTEAEEGLERSLKVSVPVIDLVLAAAGSEFRVRDLADGIVRRL